MEIREPEIHAEEILKVDDGDFTPDNVCLVNGCGTGIGRATAIAAAANNLMTVGLDVKAEEGQATQKMARDMGGQMIFVKTPLALNQIPAQAEQRGMTPEAVVSEVMMGRSRIKEMMTPVDVANLFIFGFSHFAKYLVGGDLLFDGGMVLTY